jgi:DNA-3-methyladenine glycosylase II
LILHSFEGTLKPVAPFDFLQSLEFLSDFTPMKNEQEVKSSSLTKAVEINGKPVGFEVSSLGTIEAPQLKFVAYSETNFNDEIENLLIDRINFFLSLQDDLNEFYKIAMADECFSPVIKRFFGHKQVKFLTPFEISCWAILTQRIPMSFARKMKEQIVRKFGGNININGVDYHTFPEPSKLAACSTEELLEVVPNKRKAEYLSEVVKAFSQVDEQWLRKGSYDEVLEWLKGIKGIGDWSANFVMIRGLGRMEKISLVGPDLALDAGRLYNGKDQPMTDAEVCNLAEKYGNWKGYWAYYLRIYAEFVYVFEKGKKQLEQMH